MKSRALQMSVLAMACTLMAQTDRKDAPYERLGSGSVLELSYQELGIDDPLQPFDVYVKTDTGKSQKFRLIKPVQSDVFLAEVTQKGILFDKKEMRKRQLGSFLASYPLEPVRFEEIFVKGKGVSGGQEQSIKKNIELVAPQIESLSGGFTDGQAVTLGGNYFGVEPVVYLEVQSGINFKYKRLKVDPASFRYSDAAGIPSSSCMKILASDPVDDNPVGYGEVTALFPKVSFTREVPTGYMVIENPLGMHSRIFLKDLMVDNFAGPLFDTTVDEGEERKWFFTLIETDNGFFSSSNSDNTFLWQFVSGKIGNGLCELAVQSGGHFIGLWMALRNVLNENRQLNLAQLLGPFVKAEFQPEVWGVKIDIETGLKKFKIELKELASEQTGKERKSITKSVKLKQGAVSLYMGIPPAKRNIDVRNLNFLVDGKGNASVRKVSLLYSIPAYKSAAEQVFLYSFGHLSQCWDPETGLVGDRAKYPATHFASIQCMGTFALACAIGAELGYIEAEDAKAIVGKIKDTVLNEWPTHEGVLAHFAGQVTVGSPGDEQTILFPLDKTEYSTMDGSICLISLLMACQAVGIDEAAVQDKLSDAGWDAMFDPEKKQVRHGYSCTYLRDKEGEVIKDAQGNISNEVKMLTSTWDVWSSETFLLYLAYAAATGKADFALTYPAPPTWDGSGFNDAMASLFFLMDGTDVWGNDWDAFISQSANAQANYFTEKIGVHESYKKIFGLSASEVPVPWNQYAEVPGFFSNNYAPWGVGGRNESARPYADGTLVVGYPIVAPHYAAMVSAEHPDEFENVFRFLIEERKLFSPLNNVESIGYDLSGNEYWNSLKGSWNLSLQALGAARLLSKEKEKTYLPYRLVEEIPFLSNAYAIMMPTD